MKNYDNEWAAIRSERDSIISGTQRLGWDIMRTVPNAIQRTAEHRFKQLEENDPIRLLPPSEKHRILADLVKEETRARHQTAGIARFNLEPRIDALRKRFDTYVTARRADVSLSFNGALEGLDRAGMIQLKTYELQLTPVIDGLGVAELRTRYQAALLAKDDPCAMVAATLIEARVDRGGLAKSEADVPRVRELADYVDGVRDLRVEPYDQVSSIADALTDARRAVSRAELGHIRPINPSMDPAAQSAFKATAAEYAEAVAAAAAAAR